MHTSVSERVPGDYARPVTERRPSLLEPSRLEPVHLDLRKVFLRGIALWVVALVVAVVLAVAGQIGPRIPWICAAGVALGGLALLWERRHRPTAPEQVRPEHG